MKDAQQEALDFIYEIAGKYAETLEPIENLSLSISLSKAYALICEL